MNKVLMTMAVILVFYSCESSKEKNSSKNESTIDSLQNELNDSVKIKDKSNKANTLDLVGKYQVLTDKNEYDRIYELLIEQLISPGWSDPNEYKVRNYLGFGDLWEITMENKNNILFIEGKNRSEGKSMFGSGSFNDNIDTIQIQIKIRDSENLISEKHEKWVRNR